MTTPLAKVVPVLIKKIKIPDDYVREDLGDLDPLAASIQSKNGLLDPVLLQKDFTLVAGLRRLSAAKKAGFAKIDCIIKEYDDPFQAQIDSDDLRKPLTTVEMAKRMILIEKRYKDRMGERRGNKTKDESAAEPAIKDGVATRDAAAAEAGFKNTSEGRRAKEVVENGTPELVQALSDGDISLSMAAATAKLPAKDQRAVAKATKDGPRAAADASKAAQQSLVDRKGSQDLRNALKTGSISLGLAARLAALPPGEGAADLKKALQRKAKGTAATEKNGRPKFDDRPVAALIGKLVKHLNARMNAYGKSSEHQACIDAADALDAAFKAWQKSK